MKNSPEKLYTVRRCSSNADNFEFASVLADFSFSWENVPAPSMRFSAVHDDAWLHCHFCVEDDNVLTYVHKNNKEEVLHGDRVEIFFSADRELSSYYGLEVDPNGRVYDYHASHYRKFNPEWQWPEGQLQVVSKRSEQGYEVTLRISKASLNSLHLLQNNIIIAGLFRGKCTEINLDEDRMRWISWVRPQSPSPDFHIPSAFGTFVLE